MANEVVDYNSMIFDLVSKLSRKLGRRARYKDVAHMLGYKGVSSITPWLKGQPVLHREPQWRIRMLMAMVDGKQVWPRGVVLDALVSPEVNREGMLRWFTATWDAMEEERKRAEANAKTQAAVVAARAPADRWVAPREVYDALMALERRLDTQEKAINALLLEWRGGKDAA